MTFQCSLDKRRTMKATLFLLGLSILPQFHDCHVSLTFPPARNYPLDFLDSARTKAPCGMPKGCRTYILIIWLIQLRDLSQKVVAMLWCNELVANWVTKPLRSHVCLADCIKYSYLARHWSLPLTLQTITSLLYFLNMSVPPQPSHKYQHSHCCHW